jgi:hypothetical protein
VGDSTTACLKKVSIAGGQSVLPGIQVGKIELIAVKGALPYRPAATGSSSSVSAGIACQLK